MRPALSALGPRRHVRRRVLLRQVRLTLTLTLTPTLTLTLTLTLTQVRADIRFFHRPVRGDRVGPLGARHRGPVFLRLPSSRVHRFGRLYPGLEAADGHDDRDAGPSRRAESQASGSNTTAATTATTTAVTTAPPPAQRHNRGGGGGCGNGTTTANGHATTTPNGQKANGQNTRVQGNGHVRAPRCGGAAQPSDTPPSLPTPSITPIQGRHDHASGAHGSRS